MLIKEIAICFSDSVIGRYSILNHDSKALSSQISYKILTEFTEIRQKKLLMCVCVSIHECEY